MGLKSVSYEAIERQNLLHEAFMTLFFVEIFMVL